MFCTLPIQMSVTRVSSICALENDFTRANKLLRAHGQKHVLLIDGSVSFSAGSRRRSVFSAQDDKKILSRVPLVQKRANRYRTRFCAGYN
jgi:hypothetical protein